MKNNANPRSNRVIKELHDHLATVRSLIRDNSTNPDPNHLCKIIKEIIHIELQLVRYVKAAQRPHRLNDKGTKDKDILGTFIQRLMQTSMPQHSPLSFRPPPPEEFPEQP